MTTKLSVETQSAHYPVVIGNDILNKLPHYLGQIGVTTDNPLFLVSDDNLSAAGYVQSSLQLLRTHGYSVESGIVAPSDASKSLRTAEHLYEQMVSAGLRRNGVVLALGGGMVGDLAGFVAATYYRGIPYVQLPTTLLAHDSSIGGKVAVNLASGKNLVGAFYHPHAVLFDVSTLATLPVREWRGGMAEVIKHGIIGDPTLFSDLLAQPVSEFPGEVRAEALIARACQVKIGIVQRDERERGERMKLNLGHSVGHGVEQYSEYRLNHGEAVAIGICIEAEVSVQRGCLAPDARDQIIAVFQQHGLPTSTAGYPFAEVAPYIDADKKNAGKHWTFALPTAIGEVTVARDVTRQEVAHVWAARV